MLLDQTEAKTKSDSFFTKSYGPALDPLPTRKLPLIFDVAPKHVLQVTTGLNNNIPSKTTIRYFVELLTTQQRRIICIFHTHMYFL